MLIMVYCLHRTSALHPVIQACSVLIFFQLFQTRIILKYNIWFSFKTNLDYFLLPTGKSDYFFFEAGGKQSTKLLLPGQISQVRQNQPPPLRCRLFTGYIPWQNQLTTFLRLLMKTKNVQCNNFQHSFDLDTIPSKMLKVRTMV